MAPPPPSLVMHNSPNLYCSRSQGTARDNGRLQQHLPHPQEVQEDMNSNTNTGEHIYNITKNFNTSQSL